MARPQTASAKSSFNRSAGSAAPKPPQPPLDEAPPIKQRRGMFYALLAIFFVWIVAILVMYFTTVRSHGGRLEPLPTASTGPSL